MLQQFILPALNFGDASMPSPNPEGEFPPRQNSPSGFGQGLDLLPQPSLLLYQVILYVVLLRLSWPCIIIVLMSTSAGIL
jgi:hypothetical protein